jgi:hypothetical protein
MILFDLFLFYWIFSSIVVSLAIDSGTSSIYRIFIGFSIGFILLPIVIGFTINKYLNED